VLISDKNKLPDFEDLVRSSKFCLAPWGHGWGNRLGMYMILGCVPVIVQVRRMRESLKVCMQCVVLHHAQSAFGLHPPAVCMDGVARVSHPWHTAMTHHGVVVASAKL
jgi:hypothetical protein